MEDANQEEAVRPVKPRTKKHRDRLGIMFFGGYGSNTARWLVDALDPKHYPDFSHFVANTDGSIQDRHFGDKKNENQKRWGKNLILHQLGGTAVTNGRGAGADPKVGRRAARTQDSMKAMKAFIERQNVVLIATGLGGGTGTGAAPVAAALASRTRNIYDNSKIPVAVLATLPFINEGDYRMEYALEALKEIQDLGVTTFPIQNEALSHMLKTMPPEERKKITHADKWRLVNEQTIQPLLLGLQEVIQEPADLMNRDVADWRTLLGYGVHGFASLVQFSEGMDEAELLKQALHGPFNDIGVVRSAEGLFFWFHGPWPDQQQDGFIDAVKKEALRTQPDRKVHIHWGLHHKAPSEKLWVLVVAVSKQLPAATIVDPKGRALIADVASAPEPETAPQKNGRLYPLECSNGGVLAEANVPADLLKEYQQAISDSRTKPTEMQAILEKIAPYNEGIVPDMPDKFTHRPPASSRPGVVRFSR